MSSSEGKQRVPLKQAHRCPRALSLLLLLPTLILGNREDVSGCELLETQLTGWKDKWMGRQNALGSNLTLTLTGAWWTPWRGRPAEPTVTRPPGVTGSGAEPGHQDLLWEVAPPRVQGVPRELITAARRDPCSGPGWQCKQ